MRRQKMAEPFVKWVGGKRQLLDRIITRLPENIGHYYEPFLGGGAVFLELGFPNSTINDINEALINTYKQIRDFPNEVMAVLSELDGKIAVEGKDFYYSTREQFNKKLLESSFDVEMAGLFIFINKHCFNGLYRVNGKGLFNVPYNNSTRCSFNRNHILEASQALKGAEILCGDFERVCDGCMEGDFVFFDSPYVPLNVTSFENYTKEGFSKENHIRLANLYKKLSSKRVRCMLTNHNAPLVNELYKDFKIEVVDVKRFINSDASNRVGQEVIITNY
jgi:DNA adenine methylase